MVIEKTKNIKAKIGMEVQWHHKIVILMAFQCSFLSKFCYSQTEDYETPAAPPPSLNKCNGVFLSYSFNSREKEFPYLKNASAQAWSFKSMAKIMNTGKEEVKGWKIHIGFHHQEILVSATNVVIVDGDDFPASVGNGTTLAGSTQVDLKTAIDTANDYNQMMVQIEMIGTMFGMKPPGVPMPKDIKLVNDGFKCPKANIKGKTYMEVCCRKDPKFKPKEEKKTKFLPRKWGDLTFTYDVLQSYGNNYLAQVTIDNIHPLGRLDHWNLTWEWMNGEFIYSMRGAYTHSRDYSQCIYGLAGKYYQDFDFSNVMSCDKKPVISDLPADRYNDSKVGKLPYCCRNGSLLPTLMDEGKARSIFQMQVFKLPPYMNRTALVPPQRWHIEGVVNPDYKCGSPFRVDPTEFPDTSGLQATSTAVASWQVVCNITKPKPQQTKCCVSFSAYYNDSAIPCNTCACGCDNNKGCSAKTSAMLLPQEALLVPFDNRTAKAVAWAKMKHFKVPNPKPCSDNCPVSINWHVSSDYKDGWTARVTIFNWEDKPFVNWFTAVQMGKAFDGYEKAYSFNGTKLDKLNKTIFLQGLKGLNYLIAETNGSRPGDPRVPGKQQSVISFKKKQTTRINIIAGDGFPKKVFFNGEECALPPHIPLKHSAGHKPRLKLLTVTLIAIITFLMMSNCIH